MRNLLLAATFLTTLTACDWNSKEDYQPKAKFETFLKDQEAAQKAQAEAVASGAVPAPAAEQPGQKTYDMFCVACHGANGAADGAAALAMNPRPRNLTDKAWQAKVDDAHIYKVIKEGGASVGLSATMAPWGAAINDAEIENVVKYVRQFGK